MILAPRIQTLVIYYVIVGKNILEFIVVLEIDAALQLWKIILKICSVTCVPCSNNRYILWLGNDKIEHH